MNPFDCFVQNGAHNNKNIKKWKFSKTKALYLQGTTIQFILALEQIGCTSWIIAPCNVI